ncbi:MAG: phosphatase PAP2 family protein [Thermoguttaceae bacterium]|nr:phosphatase PAP2 family protein [Thermoguttaceae bacterium]
MQFLLGASRPGETDYRSQWKPFDDTNAVSGHAFIGAVPFLTAAEMTENLAARAFLYVGSACTAWSRVNDDAHYLSQVILGWYMAYLACRSVEATGEDMQTLSLVPLAGPELSGLGLVWRR